ncbi:hypothetical protein SHJG_0553 [Streptomyces hygroscopicus subsp. jinggangensis 5008]|nr:hypothetical protein SHJG_0553 [Streptomyces hygroscopicus subsp. jinggangensis 5008]AGF60052.1 hypothetical protein SHJGH_0386 [Streptomyces hygroscopicus subsp. jinggangensis TL01]
MRKVPAALTAPAGGRCVPAPEHAEEGRAHRPRPGPHTFM